MAISKNELEEIIKKAFPNAIIEITDLAGDSDHYSLFIKDKVFKSMTLIQQHKMVKAALKEVLNTKLHAITIKTAHE
jgi:stress-induced morphogen